MSDAAIRGLLVVLFTFGAASFLMASQSETDGTVGADTCVTPVRADDSSLGVVLSQTEHAKGPHKHTDSVAELPDVASEGDSSAECGVRYFEVKSFAGRGFQGSLLDIVSAATAIAVQCLVPDALALLFAALGFQLIRWTVRMARTKAASRHKAAQQKPAAVIAAQVAAQRKSRILEETDAFGCTALHRASHEGNKTEVRRLIELRAFMDAREAWDETPLHFAAREGHLEVCNVLVSRGASLNAVNADDKTPLVVAVEASHESVCEFLLDNGAGVAGARDDQLPHFLTALLFRRLVGGAKQVSLPQSQGCEQGACQALAASSCSPSSAADWDSD